MSGISEERLAEIREHEARRDRDWAGSAMVRDLLAEVDRLRAENERLGKARDSFDEAYSRVMSQRDRANVGLGTANDAIAKLSTDLQDARRQITEANEKLARVEKLHKPEKRWQDSIDSDHSWDTPEEARDEMDDPEAEPFSFEICQHCGDIEGREPDLDFRESLWPCATIKALGGAS